MPNLDTNFKSKTPPGSNDRYRKSFSLKDGGF